MAASLKWPHVLVVLEDRGYFSNTIAANSILKSLSMAGVRGKLFTASTSGNNLTSFYHNTIEGPMPLLLLLPPSSSAFSTLKLALKERRIGLQRPVVCVVHDSDFDATMFANFVWIDQMLYFYKNWTFSEVYSVNGQLVANDNLGSMSRNFKYVEPIERRYSLLRPLTARRSNFQGKVMIARTEHQHPFTILTSEATQRSNYDEASDSYFIECCTGDISGIFPHALTTLERRLNFTTKVYKRQDGQWGSLNKDTGQWAGMVKDVIDGNADIITAPLSAGYDRAMVVDYLPPLGTETYSLFIRTSKMEQLSWGTYANPFTPILWAVIAVVAFGNAMLLRLIYLAKCPPRGRLSGILSPSSARGIIDVDVKMAKMGAHHAQKEQQMALQSRLVIDCSQHSCHSDYGLISFSRSTGLP